MSETAVVAAIPGTEIPMNIVVRSRTFELSNKLGHIPVQPITVTRRVNKNEDGSVRSTGYRVVFTMEDEGRGIMTWVGADEALKAGAAIEVDGNCVWAVSQLGWQPGVDGAPARMLVG